jgi:hypothetical protein
MRYFKVSKEPPRITLEKIGGIKVHAMMDAFSGVTKFARITAAKNYEKNFFIILN